MGIRLAGIVSQLMLVAGCASHNEVVDVMCHPTTGTYVERYAQRSGDCGSIPERVQLINPKAAPIVDGCRYTQAYTPDDCHVDIDSTCKTTTDGVSISERGALAWTHDGSSAKGVFEVFLTNDAAGTRKCTSTYDVTFTKI